MYNNKPYYTVIESNVLDNDAIATQSYVFENRSEAEAKLYSTWAYASNPPEGSGVQCFSVYMTETRHERTILLESRVFDYRLPEPIPEEEEVIPEE